MRSTLILTVLLGSGLLPAQDHGAPPNVILMMADDQGWGDVKHNGHPVLRTPNLDTMARNGLRFDRFYAAAPVCSPTRGSCLTGRHPYRYGVFFANRGHLLPREVTLAEELKERGFATGHFGKWHLGTLTKKGRDSNRGGGRNLQHYSPPWEHGFDVCFSTEAKVPTYDPMRTPTQLAGGVKKNMVAGTPYGTAYWTGPGERVTENLEGDDSRVIMDRVIPFVSAAAKRKQPFLAVVWFHAPHLPVVADEKHLAMYPQETGRAQHYLGCITAIDDQVGRLRSALRTLGVAQNTMLWFCSDNGPEGRKGKARGSAGPLRGRKRSLYDGGVRVPGIVEWPARVTAGSRTSVPCVTSDYLPTILAALGGKPQQPVDGIDLLPLLDGEMKERPAGIGFESGKQIAWIEQRFKLIRPQQEAEFELYDMAADPGESQDLAAQKPEVVKALRAKLATWRASCKRSRDAK